MENPIHNSFHYLFRSPLGAAKTEQSVTFRMRCGWNVMGVTLRIQSEDGMITEHMCYQFEGMWECELKMPPVPQVLWYDFYLRFVDGGTSYYIPQQGKRGGVGRLSPKARAALPIKACSMLARSWQAPPLIFSTTRSRFPGLRRNWMNAWDTSRLSPPFLRMSNPRLSVRRCKLWNLWIITFILFLLNVLAAICTWLR